MNSYPRRRVSLIGTAGVVALLIVLFVSTVSAQGAAPQGYWGNCYYPQASITSTVPYGYGCGGMGWDEGWMGGMMGWSTNNFNLQNNVSGTLPYGSGMMNGGHHGWMTLAPALRSGASAGVGDWPNYGFNQQNSVTNTTPYGSYPNMMGGWGHGMMGGWRNRWGGFTPSAPAQPPAPSSANVSFKSDVQPIFAARCVACHGGTVGLYLNLYDNVMRGGVRGPVVVPGDPSNSRLIHYVSSGYMPFRNQPLTAAQIQTLVDWVASGAPNN